MVCWATAQTIFGNSIHAVEIYVSFKDAGDAFFGERIYASQKDSREFESIKAVLYNNYYTNLAGFVSTATVHSAAYQRDGVYDALNTLRPVDGYSLNSRRIQPGHGTHDLVMELTTWSCYSCRTWAVQQGFGEYNHTSHNEPPQWLHNWVLKLGFWM